MTNLHCHILFSERENQQDLVPKIYKKTNGEIEILINWQRQIVKTLIFMQERETSKRIKREILNTKRIFLLQKILDIFKRVVLIRSELPYKAF